MNKFHSLAKYSEINKLVTFFTLEDELIDILVYSKIVVKIQPDKISTEWR